MKTIKHKTGEIKRLSNVEAEKLIKQKHLGWTYCAKSEFKKNGN